MALPTGEGILAFRTAEEAVAPIGEVTSDYPRHSRAARELAEAYFDAEMILARLVDEAVA